MRGHRVRRVLLAAVLALSLAPGLSACSQAGDEPVRPDPHLVGTMATSLATRSATSLRDSAMAPGLSAYGVCYEAYRDYVYGRIVTLNFSTGDPMWFGPWEAKEDLFSDEASATGELTEWAPDYYITHDWSTYGQQILTMAPGDTVTINGRTLSVEGVYDYPKDAFLDEVRFVTGSDTVVLQTCEPNSELNRIVYGHEN